MLVRKKILDELYSRYNRREFVHPDPLEFLYDYKDIHDREIVGFIASSLAYGRVAQILKSVSSVFERMTSPSIFLKHASRKSLFKTFKGFKHRFTTEEEIAAMLFGIKRVIKRYGSLHACFTACMNDDDATILPALSAFVKKLIAESDRQRNSLVPLPTRGSACKRLLLFLRWMVRKDEVDPGGWDNVPKSRLIVPLDTHMHRIGLALGLTQRKQADMRTAIEITTAFRTISPDDPVKYDFALTRLGIRDDTDMDAFLKQCNVTSLF
ncbi:MAG: TIGR02757 family protein [Desulfobacterales bacterium]|nr:TIGR02757 family protein [Desulfobacterales bacterium]